MAEQSFFDRVSTHASHVPDVLSCIANLSNDEVFTPPEVVNRMLDLLPQELFADPNTTFLDPATKTGVFLREIAKRCLDAQLPGYKERSLEISEKKSLNIPLDEYDFAFQKQLQERIDHIFHNQLYAIGITELTSLLARRSVYCSKYPNGPYSITHFDNAEGNIRFRRTEHTWKDGKCVFCGASEIQFGEEARGDLETHAYEFIHTIRPEDTFKMKFDVIISNPPYQLNDGGNGASAKPIYNHFVRQAIKLNPRYLTMIIPARWYAGGKGLDVFRDSMLRDKHIRVLHDFVDASDCFSGVEIKGGICYFLWDRDNVGTCTVVSHKGNTITSKLERPLLENDSNTFIRYNNAIEILRKVKSLNEDSFDEMVSSRKPFSFPSNFRDYLHKKTDSNTVFIFAQKDKGYVSRQQIEKNIEWVDKWKVFVPEAIGAGNMAVDIVKPIIGEPNTVCSETYLVIGPVSSKNEAENVSKYIGTKFFHFLLGLKKITQHTTSKTYSFIPKQDFSQEWTDEKLYKKYGLTDREINFIELSVWPDNGLGGDENG